MRENNRYHRSIGLYSNVNDFTHRRANNLKLNCVAGSVINRGYQVPVLLCLIRFTSLETTKDFIINNVYKSFGSVITDF
jgi:hypothetical protein